MRGSTSADMERILGVAGQTGGMSSEVHMKMAPPEELARPSFYGHPEPHYHYDRPPMPVVPLDPAQQKSRKRLTIWSWIALGYAFINIGSAFFAVVLAYTVALTGLLLTFALGDAGPVLGGLVAIGFMIWLASIPAAAVVGLVCAIRAGRLHRQLVPMGQSAQMPKVVGWIAFGLASLITVVMVAQAIWLFGSLI